MSTGLRPPTLPFLVVAVCVLGASGPFTRAVEIRTQGLAVELDLGTVTGMRAGDGTVLFTGGRSGLGGIGHLDPEMKVGHEAVVLETFAEPIPTRDAIAVWQTASAPAGLHGVRWGIGGIPLTAEILVPGNSGIRLHSGLSQKRFVFDYPMTWEAQFVIVDLGGHGFWVCTEDVRGRYKELEVTRSDTGWDLVFTTRSQAPFADLTRAESVPWIIRRFENGWQTAASVYREWANTAFGLTPLEAQDPAWVRDIRGLFICSLDTGLLDDLVLCVDPAQTILYVPDWRVDGYDRNYPDYTAVPELRPLLTRAHELGFRVMLHVNYFGCDPKHPLYEQFEPYQARDPFTHEKLWWDWPMADPPIKFAYINPASDAWRELFVSRMVELCTEYPVDALHLDQTLCIWNHAGGLIDGRTMIEGNILEHRELRRALPHVALSGEGLNEVTFRYEAFAQRHVWGLDHVRGKWSLDKLACAHPVAAYLFRPYTIINGYLGMSPPANAQLYAAWMEAHRHWGVIPTFSRPAVTDLRAPRGFARQTLDEMLAFQRLRLDPAPERDWDRDTLFPFRGVDGVSARFADTGQGAVLESRGPDGEHRVHSRTVSGVESYHGPGTVENAWIYDAEAVHGLEPERWYPCFDHEPRDLERFHLEQVSGDLLVTDVAIGERLTSFAISRKAPAFLVFSTVLDEARSGYDLDTEEAPYVQQGPMEDERTGAAFVAVSDGLLNVHPPWRVGTGSVFAEWEIELPRAESVWFRSRVALDMMTPAGESDGALFRVEAEGQGRTAAREALAGDARGADLDLDLSAWTGRMVRIRLSVDPGPDRDPSFDWARWLGPRIEARREGSVEFEVVTGGRSWDRVLGPEAAREVASSVLGRVRLTAPVPASLFLVRGTVPEAPGLPFRLEGEAAIPVFLIDGQAVESSPSAALHAGENEVGGVVRTGMLTHPPEGGETQARYHIRLPEDVRRFRSWIGLRDGSKSEGVTFRVEINGSVLVSRHMEPGEWEQIHADLQPFAGREVVLGLVADSEESYYYDWACWGEPCLE